MLFSEHRPLQRGILRDINTDNFNSGIRRSHTMWTAYSKNSPRMLSRGRPPRSATGTTHSLATHGSSSCCWSFVATGKKSLLSSTSSSSSWLTLPFFLSLPFPLSLSLSTVYPFWSFSLALSLNRHLWDTLVTMHGETSGWKNDSFKDGCSFRPDE